MPSIVPPVVSITTPWRLRSVEVDQDSLREVGGCCEYSGAVVEQAIWEEVGCSQSLVRGTAGEGDRVSRPNGADNSTTMRSIVGLDRPTSGEALIGGQRYAELHAPLREVGTLLDTKSAHRSRRAVDHLRTVATTHGIARKRVDEVIGLAGLESVAHHRLRDA